MIHYVALAVVRENSGCYNVRIELLFLLLSFCHHLSYCHEAVSIAFHGMKGEGLRVIDVIQRVKNRTYVE